MTMEPTGSAVALASEFDTFVACFLPFYIVVLHQILRLLPAVSIIDFRQVSKSYPVYLDPKDRSKNSRPLIATRFTKTSGPFAKSPFTVERGETFCVIGENGSGKSTLLQIVAGIMRPRQARRLYSAGSPPCSNSAPDSIPNSQDAKMSI